MRNPQKTQELEDGSRLEIWNLRRDRFDSDNNLISRFVLTTVGRVVMNYTIIDSVSKTSSLKTFFHLSKNHDFI